jgi:glucans biosynthesis protein C
MSAPPLLTSVPTDRPAAAPQRPRRLHGLDWLRGGATLLVVALHAGIAYLVAPMPGLVWATSQTQPHLAVDAATWWINSFVMPLFFVLGGFVAVGLMRRTGPAAFARHRTARLMGPFLLGCVLILPLDLYVWLLGWAAEGQLPLKKLRSLKVDGPLAEGLWGVSHLWFLQYLWLFCVAAAVLVWNSNRRRQDHLPSSAPGETDDFLSRPQPFSVLRTRYGDDLIAVLLGVSIVALYWQPEVVIGFRHSWWPLPANLLFYAPWFAIGWLMAARQPRRRTPRGEWRLAASLAMFAVLWPLIHRHVETPLAGQARLVLVSLFVIHAWLAVTGWIGVCLRWLDRRPPASVRYLAAASFWIYLLHHPVVGLAQVTLRPLALPVPIKFALTLTAGVALPLLTYEVLVRRTWIGQILNGRRDLVTALPALPPQETVPSVPMPVPVPEAQPDRKAA